MVILGIGPGYAIVGYGVIEAKTAVIVHWSMVRSPQNQHKILTGAL